MRPTSAPLPRGGSKFLEAGCGDNCGSTREEEDKPFQQKEDIRSSRSRGRGRFHRHPPRRSIILFQIMIPVQTPHLRKRPKQSAAPRRSKCGRARNHRQPRTCGSRRFQRIALQSRSRGSARGSSCRAALAPSARGSSCRAALAPGARGSSCRAALAEGAEAAVAEGAGAAAARGAELHCSHAGARSGGQMYLQRPQLNCLLD